MTNSRTSDLAALRLQLEYGADEALEDSPVRRDLTPVRGAAIPASGNLPAIHRPAIIPVDARDAHAVAEAAENLEALQAALAGFDPGGLAATATRLVFADGEPTAALLVIGDVPGADDDRAGRPFAGAAGERLDRLLGSVGIDRAQLRLTTLIPWRPPGNRPVTEGEVKAFLPFLHRHVALVRPRRLLLIGVAPGRALLGPAAPSNLPRLRSRWWDVSLPGLDATIPALVLPALDQALRGPGERRAVWADLRLLRRTLDQD